MDLRSVFNSEPKSLFDTISEAGVCFYLPAYQRPYTWNKKNVLRIFEDVLNGIENVMRNQESITFIGTLLSVHDTKYQTINPLKRGEVPKGVMLVIDGQQRLTTLLLICVGLHDFFSTKQVKLQKLFDKAERELKILDVESTEFSHKNQFLNDLEWLIESVTTTIADLRHFVTNTNSNRDPIYRWYPKLIRAYVDCWSKTEHGATYGSPIARLLSEYNKHVVLAELNNSEHTQFRYDLSAVQQDAERHKIVSDNFKTIISSIRKISKNQFVENEKLDVQELQDSEFSQAFHFQIPDAFTEDECPSDVCETLLIIIFAKYFLNRVCVTNVTVNDEAYAFDMFEALNTTGEPLTSLETFKPKIVEDEGIQNYESSLSKTYFDSIDSYLEKFEDASKKHKETSRVLISFALAESGEKISKHIGDQRNFLLNRYRELGEGLDCKRKFIGRINDAVLAIYREWEGKAEFFSNKESEHNLLELSFELLRESNHEITLSLLQRMLSDSQFSNVTRRERMVKGIVAFYALWRGAHQNTAGIDTVYRELLKNGLSASSLDPQCTKCSSSINIDNLLSAFKEKLIDKIAKEFRSEIKEHWVTKANAVGIYSNNKPLTRLFLLLSMNDTCSDKEVSHLIVKGPKNSCPMLNFTKWKKFGLDDNSQFTIEHIIPQSPTDEWDIDPDNLSALDTLGNLTILPRSENSSASNNSWLHKKTYFKSMCSRDYSERQNLLKDIQINDVTRSLFMNSHCAPHLESLTQISNFDVDIVKSRGKSMYSIVFDTLWSWLN